MASETLIDSNVLVAAVVQHHVHHVPSSALLLGARAGTFAVADHSFAETYVTLTKRAGGAPFAWPTRLAQAAIDEIAARTRLVGLSPMETLASVRRYAAVGGVGARLYDYLIGETALHAGCRRLVTWNVSHFTELFPQLAVLTPSEIATAR